MLPGVSRSRVQKIIADGRVSVNGVKTCKKNTTLQINDIVDVDINDGGEDGGVLTHPSARPPKAQNIPLDFLYEDEYFAVINKPAGLIVHPGSGNPDGTVVNALLHRFGAGNVSGGPDASRPGIVHRLDKDTSGALIVAKTDAAHTALAGLFSSRAIKKIYTGFCVGPRPLEHEVIDLPLARCRRDPVKRAVDSRRGSQAVTEYRLKAHNCGISLMEFVLHTGRTHQIRVHCSHKGFPIVQDALYGGSQDRVTKIAPMERPFAYSVFKCFSRHALHALSLSFTHPFTGVEFEASAPYPEDFCRAAAFLTSTLGEGGDGFPAPDDVTESKRLIV
jgi:23S rRNA pseudouridine1911/1915/1917 synthase